MEPGTLEKKIAKLPEELKLKVEGFVDALINDYNHSEKTAFPLKSRGYGSLKGKIWMSEDFNEPLEDFKEYM